MGLFDYVNFGMPCPKCGAFVAGFQTKDAACSMMTVEPESIGRFYSSCSCGAWLEFSRTRPENPEPRFKPLTRAEVEALGFELSVSTTMPHPPAEWDQRLP